MIGGMDEDREPWFGGSAKNEVIVCIIWTLFLMTPLFGFLLLGLLLAPFVFGPILAALGIYLIVRQVNRLHDPHRAKRPHDAP